MTNSQRTFFRQLNFLFDTSIVVATFCLTYAIREHISALPKLGDFNTYAWLLVFSIISWNIALHINTLYPTSRLRKLGEAVWIITKSGLLVVIAAVVILYIFKIKFISRPFFIGFNLLCILCLVVKEIIVEHYFLMLRLTKKNLKNAILIGDSAHINKLNDILKNNLHLGIDVVGFMTLDGNNSVKDETLKYLGETPALRRQAHRYPVDLVIVGFPEERRPRIEEILVTCEEEGIEAWVAADVFHLMIAKTTIDELEGTPFLVFRTTPSMSYQLLLKRLMDIVISIILLIVLLPIFLIIIIVIRLDSPGPAVFKQRRVGLRGRRFIMLKFRTMVTDAEQRRDELKRLNIMKGPVFKVKNDPRVTPVGRFLRKSSLDEFPQLWNVLRGNMSLVGPRPPVPTEVSHYKGWQRRRLSMKPGLTCLWQISGRSEITDFDEWARLDLQYIDNWSLWIDIMILFKTIPVVLFGKGAK